MIQKIFYRIVTDVTDLNPSSITVFFSIRATLHTSAAFTGIGLRAGRSLL